MPDPTAPKHSQLEDFIATPMGPGLTGDEAPGQSVHPQAPQPPATSPASAASGGASPSDRTRTDPTKQAPGQALGSEIAAARIGLGDGVLRAAGTGGSGDTGGAIPTAGDVGGANAAGFGASLGVADPTPKSIAPAADPDGAGNEQADARLDQARAQGGSPERAAPDQTRAEGTAGSINETDGL